MNQVAPALPNPDAKTSGQAVWSLALGILSITCLWILGSIPAIILGIMSIRKVDRSGGALKGKGMGIAGIVTGGAGVLLGLIPLAIVASVTMPALTVVHERAEAAKQAGEIRSLLLACRSYSSDFDGRFPDELQELMPDYLDAEEGLTWESNASQGEAMPYLYRSGLSDTSFSREPLIAGPEPIMGKRVVGFVGGHVESIPEADFQSDYADQFPSQ